MQQGCSVGLQYRCFITSHTSRTSTDERSVKLLADVLEEDRRATCEELFIATRAKTSQENAQEPTSVARGWVCPSTRSRVK